MTAITEDKDTKLIKALIARFFDAINAGDTKALQSHFLPSSNLTIIRQDPPAQREQVPEKDDAESKVTVLIRTTIETFVKMIEDGKKRREGKPGPNLYEWPIINEVDIKLDGSFGIAWCPFGVNFDDKLHHYGKLVFTLAFTSTPGGEGPHDKEWKILGLEQSYRRTPGWEGQTSGII